MQRQSDIIMENCIGPQNMAVLVISDSHSAFMVIDDSVRSSGEFLKGSHYQ